MVQGDFRTLISVARWLPARPAPWLLVAVMAMGLSACSSVYQAPDIYDIGETRPTESSAQKQVPDVIVSPVLPDADRPPADDALYGSAAESLLESAVHARAEGRTQAASLYLERAIRIAPGSSWLYKEMAELRLDESDARAAEGFVRHALRNAPADNEAYQASLWSLLAGCLERQGKQQQAAEASRQAADLENPESGSGGWLH